MNLNFVSKSAQLWLPAARSALYLIEKKFIFIARRDSIGNITSDKRGRRDEILMQFFSHAYKGGCRKHSALKVVR